MPRDVRILSLGILMLLLTPPLSLAQTEQRAMYELPSLSIEMATAAPQSEQAMALFSAGNWKEAGQLYEKTGTEAAKNSVEAYRAYDMAARMYFYGHDYTAARWSMGKAAEIAEATGDLVSAAYRHVDAAFIAVWEGYSGSRRDHVRRAEELAGRPEVSPEHAAKIASLIQGVTALPVSDTRGN